MYYYCTLNDVNNQDVLQLCLQIVFRGTMKSIIRTGMGYGAWGIAEKPIPKPGKDDVLIKVRAAGLCGSDMNIYSGKNTSALVGVTIGHEFSGEVIETGSDVTRFKVGDRVVSDNTGTVCGVCHACSEGNYLMCHERKGLGFQLDGGFAEYVLIPGDGLRTFPNCLMKIPDNVSFEAAAILDPYANAFNALIQQGKMVPGDIVLVAGAGPLALSAIEMARIAGASLIICLVRSSTSSEARDVAKKYGANVVLESDKDDYVSYVLNKTDNEGIPIVIDAAGSNSLYDSFIALLRRGGRLVKVGYDFGPLSSSLVAATVKNISIVGHMGYNPVSWKQILALLDAGMINPDLQISEIMSLEDYQSAVDLVLLRKVIKVVFRP